MSATGNTTQNDLTLADAIALWGRRVEELVRRHPEVASPDHAVRRAAEIELSDELAHEFTADHPEQAKVRVEEIHLPSSTGPLRLFHYRDIRREGPQPSQLVLHGGGFVGGSIDEEIGHRLIRARVLDTGLQFFALEYRLAPEHPFPAAIDDSEAALRGLQERAAELEIDPTRLGVGGFSAGGNLALALALRLRGTDRAPSHVCAEVPAASLLPAGASSTDYAEGFGLGELEVATRAYLGENGDPRNPEASPLLAESLEGFPPTLIYAAEFDPLRDGAAFLSQRLASSGVRTSFRLGEGHWHGTACMTAVTAAARQWNAEIAEELRAAYGTEPARRSS